MSTLNNTTAPFASAVNRRPLSITVCVYCFVLPQPLFHCTNVPFCTNASAVLNSVPTLVHTCQILCDAVSSFKILNKIGLKPKPKINGVDGVVMIRHWWIRCQFRGAASRCLWQLLCQIVPVSGNGQRGNVSGRNFSGTDWQSTRGTSLTPPTIFGL